VSVVCPDGLCRDEHGNAVDCDDPRRVVDLDVRPGTILRSTLGELTSAEKLRCNTEFLGNVWSTASIEYLIRYSKSGPIVECHHIGCTEQSVRNLFVCARHAKKFSNWIFTPDDLDKYLQSLPRARDNKRKLTARKRAKKEQQEQSCLQIAKQELESLKAWNRGKQREASRLHKAASSRLKTLRE